MFLKHSLTIVLELILTQDADRPLTWEKQRHDQILSGVLISKARPDLKSKVLPTTRIIKNVGQTG